MKACLPLLGTKVAFSHPVGITSETNGLYQRFLHRATANTTEASFTVFTHSEYISQLLIVTNTFPHQQSSSLFKSWY